MRDTKHWSPAFRHAVVTDLLDAIGSDPLSPENASLVFRNWEKLDAFDKAAYTLTRKGAGATDGDIEDARQAYRDIDWVAVLFTGEVEQWLRDVVTVQLPGVDWR